MSDLASALIEQSEGCELTAYKDTQGLWTIGVGHLLAQTQDYTGYTITQDQADQFLAEDMSRSRMLATEFPNYQTMNDVRQAVCVSMCFQLGSSPLHWPHFIAALKIPDYVQAAAQGLDSLWAQQTSNRAKREMQMLSTGIWINEDGTSGSPA
jgi:lysozyme